MLQALVDEGDLYSRLARSIAPEIWGHEDVKKVGAHQQTWDHLDMMPLCILAYGMPYCE
jgi:hypothetical protein